jgi:uncharacterized protein (DUF885 family)
MKPKVKQVSPTEIERYMAIQVETLSYKIGQLKNNAIATKHKIKWGKIRHQEIPRKVLESDVMPLALLESKIDAWIAEK